MRVHWTQVVAVALVAVMSIIDGISRAAADAVGAIVVIGVLAPLLVPAVRGRRLRDDDTNAGEIGACSQAIATPGGTAEADRESGPRDAVVM